MAKTPCSTARIRSRSPNVVCYPPSTGTAGYANAMATGSFLCLMAPVPTTAPFSLRRPARYNLPLAGDLAPDVSAPDFPGR